MVWYTPNILFYYFQELTVAFCGLVHQFDTQFAAVAAQVLEEERSKDKMMPIVSAEVPGGWNLVTQTTGNAPALTLQSLLVFCLC